MHVYVVRILMLIKQTKNIRIAAKACTKAALVSLYALEKKLSPLTSNDINLFKTHQVDIMWLRPHTDIMWWHEIHEAKIFSWQSPHEKAQFLTWERPV